MRYLFTVRYPYQTNILRQRASSLLSITWLTVVAWAIYVFGAALPRINEGLSFDLYLTPSLLVLPFASAVTIIALQTGRLRIATVIFTYMLLLSTASLLFTSPDGMLPLAIIPALIAGGVLLNRRQYIPIVLITLGLLIGRTVWLANFTEPYQFVPSNNADLILIVPLVTLGTAAAFLYVFSGNDVRNLNDALTLARFMQIAADHGATTPSNADEATLLSDLVKVFETEFKFSNVQIYMTSDERQLVRRARMALGMTDKTMQNVVMVGSTGLVGQAAASRVVYATDSSSSSTDLATLPPPARRALAIPLIAEDVLLGVLEASSEDNRPFDQEQIEAMAIVVQRSANLITIHRRMATLNSELHEAQDNLDSLTSLLREQDARLKDTIRTTWNTYVSKYGQGASGYDLVRESESYHLAQAADFPNTLRQILENGEPIIETQGDTQTLTIPIAFRGELLGGMSFSLAPGQPLTQRKIELARSVAERLGTALENTRLLEQTQAQAEREYQASTIGARLTGATDVQSVLDLAAAEFQTALGAVYARAYLEGTPEDARAEQETP